MDFKRVLIAVDESPIAAHAAEVGSELARHLGAELGFIHAVDPTEDYAPESGAPAADVLGLAEQDGKKLLEHFRQRAALEGWSALAFSSVGKPAHEILNAAREWHADVVVLGSHGRRGIRRVVLGSVAEGVMRHATCPVFVVRAPE